MTYKRVYTGLLIAAAMGSPLTAQNLTRADTALAGGLDAYIEKARRDWEVPGIAIAIVRNDTVIAAKGYGVRELGKPDLMDGHTLFDIASLTKSFAATAAAILVDEGKLRWDAPVRTYLPELHFPDAYLDREVTLRDLLSHRVGLNPSNWIFRFLGEEGTDSEVRRVRHLKTSAPFRSTLVYWNVGYWLVGHATARAAGIAWPAFVQTRILEPLQMRESYINGALPEPGNAARPHAVLKGVHQRIRSTSDIQGGPPSGVRTTATDMARWLRFQMGDGALDGRRIVSARALEETHSPQIIIPTTATMRRARLVNFFAAYGFGWQIMDYRGHRMWWHSGNADGMISYMAILPDERIGVFVMINSWIAPTLHGTIAARILDTYLGVEPRDWSAEGLTTRAAQRQREAEARHWLDSLSAHVAAPAHPLSAYAGVYADNLYGPIRVSLGNDGQLALQIGRGMVADLRPEGGDTLFVHWRDPLFEETFSTLATFNSDARGRLTSIRLPLARDTITARREASGRP